MPYGTTINGIIAAIFCVVVPMVLIFAHRMDVRRRRSPNTPSKRRIDDPKSCPRCGYDLRASGDRCPECGVFVWSRKRYLRQLAYDWPSTDIECRQVAPTEHATPLLRTGTPQEAALLCDQLRARGIPAFVNRRDTPDLFLTGRSVSDSVVLVYDEDFVEANAYLCRVRGLPIDADENVSADW